MISTAARYGHHYVFYVCFLSNKNGTAQKLGRYCQVLLSLVTAKWHKSKPHITVFVPLPDSSLGFTRRRLDFPPGHYIALKNFTLWKWILTGNFSPFCFYKNVREMERKIRKYRGVIYPGNLSWTQHEIWVKMQSHTGIIRAPIAAKLRLKSVKADLPFPFSQCELNIEEIIRFLWKWGQGRCPLLLNRRSIDFKANS